MKQKRGPPSLQFLVLWNSCSVFFITLISTKDYSKVLYVHIWQKIFASVVLIRKFLIVVKQCISGSDQALLVLMLHAGKVLHTFIDTCLSGGRTSKNTCAPNFLQSNCRNTVWWCYYIVIVQLNQNS